MLRTGIETLGAEKLEAGCQIPTQGFLGHLMLETGSLPIFKLFKDLWVLTVVCPSHTRAKFLHFLAPKAPHLSHTTMP